MISQYRLVAGPPLIPDVTRASGSRHSGGKSGWSRRGTSRSSSNSSSMKLGTVITVGPMSNVKPSRRMT